MGIIQPNPPPGVSGTACNNTLPKCGDDEHLEIGSNGCLVCVPNNPGYDTPANIIPGPPPPGMSCQSVGGGCWLCSDGNVYCNPCPPGSPTPGDGGNGGGPYQPPADCPKCIPCKNHDGTIVDQATKQPLNPDPDRCVIGLISIPQYCGVAVDAIPYCDDLPCPVPSPPTASQVCDKCTKESLDKIAAILQKLLDKNIACIDENGSIAAKCLGTIAKQIGDYLFPAAKTCGECCERIKMGLSTQVSCQTAFAGCECQRCTDACSGTNEGQCCNYCGSPNCTCKNGECISVQSDKKLFSAWCNGNTGAIDWTNNDSPPNGDNGWIEVGVYDTQEDALKAAQAYCQKSGGQPNKPPQLTPYYPLPVGPSPSGQTGGCDAANFATPAAANTYLSAVHYVDTIGSEVGNAVTNLITQFGGYFTDQLGLGSAASGFGTRFANQESIIDVLGKVLVNLVGCDSPNMINGLVVEGVAGFCDRWFGTDIRPYITNVHYAMHAACRKRIMSPEQAMAACLSGSLPVGELDRYYAAEGYCTDVSVRDLQSSRSKPVPEQLIRLLRWGVYDQDTYDAGMRQLGYVDQKVVDDLYSVSFIQPSLGEVLHMMIRDADNQPIVDRFRFDDRFEDKFGPTLQKFCKRQGIPEEVVRMNFRAHWDIPSKTELFEFWRRLRNLPDGDPAKITEEDLRAALTHNNVLPKWFDSYLAIAYQPLGRIDLRRGYQIGSLTDDQVSNGLQQLGYSDENIKLLLGFFKRLKEQAAPAHPSMKLWKEGQLTATQAKADLTGDGYTNDQIDRAFHLAGFSFKSGKLASSFQRGDLTAQQFRDQLALVGVPNSTISAILDELGHAAKYNDAIDSYKSGTITRTTAVNRLQAYGVDSRIVVNRLDAVDDELDAKRASRCSSSIRKRFLLGELDNEKAKGELLSAGIVAESADKQISGWQCERKARNKAIPTQTLCGWLARGSISPDDFIRRLQSLGFTDDDASQLLVDCLSRINVKRAQDEAKRIKQEQADENRAIARARRTAADADKQSKAIEAARKAQIALRAKRQAQLLHAAGLVMKGCDCTELGAIEAVNQAVEQSREMYGLTLDEAIKVAVQASENNWGGRAQDYIDKALALASLVHGTEAEVSQPEL